MNITYDFHLHSCLSPCGDETMTPNNIVQMSKLIGLDAIAVADHNSAKNLPAVWKLGAELGITVVPAMEVCSAEEIHLLCLFPTLTQALDCDRDLYPHLPPVKNKVEFFGKQQILDENDVEIGTEPLLLINALSLGLEELLPLVRSYGGFVLPAHIEKSSTSILSSLGFVPPEYGFTWAECKNLETAHALGFHGNVLTNSDAHQLEAIQEPSHHLEVAENTAFSIVNRLKSI
ncbi:MAG: PHP domain-containing protein [Eubacteriales bacterium]